MTALLTAYQFTVTLLQCCSTSGSVDVCSPSKEEMCSSVYGIRNQTLSYLSTSGSCSISESCTNLFCALIVDFKGFIVPYSLNITLLPCSDPYGVHVYGASVLLQVVVIDDTFIQSKNLTVSFLGSKAEVIVDIRQQCYGLTLSVSCYSFYLLLFTITVLLTSLRLGFLIWVQGWSSYHQLTYTCSVPHPQVSPCH